jgi:hypothetical protein
MVSRGDVAGLVRKYEEIVRLRRASEANPGHDPRRQMADLAAEFPGALREADELPMEELERRLEALREVETGALTPAAWMTTMARFHALTRGALCAKKWLRGRRVIDHAVTLAFDVEAAGLCYADDARAWRGELARLANPPRGRVTEVVFERMAVELGVEVDAVRREVFSERRREKSVVVQPSTPQ